MEHLATAHVPVIAADGGGPKGGGAGVQPYHIGWKITTGGVVMSAVGGKGIRRIKWWKGVG